MRHIYYKDGPAKGTQEDFQHDLEVGDTIYVPCISPDVGHDFYNHPYKVVSLGVAEAIYEQPCGNP